MARRWTFFLSGPILKTVLYHDILLSIYPFCIALHLSVHDQKQSSTNPKHLEERMGFFVQAIIHRMVDKHLPPPPPPPPVKSPSKPALALAHSHHNSWILLLQAQRI